MISTTALVKLPITVDKLAVSFMKLTIARRRSVDEPERKVTRLMREKNAGFRVSGYSRWVVKAGKTWRNSFENVSNTLKSKDKCAGDSSSWSRTESMRVRSRLRSLQIGYERTAQTQKEGCLTTGSSQVMPKSQRPAPGGVHAVHP